MNWKEQIVFGLLVGPFLIWRAYVNYVSVPTEAPWGAHLDLILAPAGLALLWEAVNAFRKRNDPQFLGRVRTRSRDQAFDWLVITGFMAVPFFWPRPFWTRPFTYGSFVLLGLIIFFARHTFLCYRAPRNTVKGTNSPFKVVVPLVAMMVLASIGTYIFPPMDMLRDQWTEMRLFGFAADFFRSLAAAAAGVLLLTAALSLGGKMIWDAIRRSRRQA